PDPCRPRELSGADAAALGLWLGSGRARHGAAQLPDECRHGAGRGAGHPFHRRLRPYRDNCHCRDRAFRTFHPVSWGGYGAGPARIGAVHPGRAPGAQRNRLNLLRTAFGRRKAAVMSSHDLRQTSGKGQPMNAFQKVLGGAMLAQLLAGGLAAPAMAQKLDNKKNPPPVTTTTVTGDIDFGDDSSPWANDGECDDPRFEGSGSATELVDSDILKDATDCRAAYEAGTVTLVEGGA